MADKSHRKVSVQLPLVSALSDISGGHIFFSTVQLLILFLPVRWIWRVTLLLLHILKFSLIRFIANCNPIIYCISWSFLLFISLQTVISILEVFSCIFYVPRGSHNDFPSYFPNLKNVSSWPPCTHLLCKKNKEMNTVEKYLVVLFQGNKIGNILNHKVSLHDNMGHLFCLCSSDQLTLEKQKGHTSGAERKLVQCLSDVASCQYSDRHHIRAHIKCLEIFKQPLRLRRILFHGTCTLPLLRV
jgi:hypothetical protein